MSAEAVVRLLADEARLRVFAAIVLGGTATGQIQAMTGLAEDDVLAAVRRLLEAELVTTVDGVALVPRIATRQRAAGPAPAPAPRRDTDRFREAVLRAFIVDGRLVSMPSKQSRRRVVLEFIVTRFTPGVRYQEREVDLILQTFHHDHASLRRHLVDADLLARDGGEYWRIGGPVA
jgi:hypothetical protein